MNKKVILLILDGWGYRAEKDFNAIAESNAVNFNTLVEKDPSILIDASGEQVGLPMGQMGNSEVGHTNLGAGRIVYQDLVNVTRSFKNGEAVKIKEFDNFLKNVKNKSGRMHIVGLLSDGGVHSHIDHFKSVILAAAQKDIKEIYVHAITDGRDTPPESAVGYVENLNKWMKDNNAGVIADLCGRFYAMDRDNRWDRVEKAYKMYFESDGKKVLSIVDAVKASHSEGVTDEFIKPIVFDTNGGIKDGDGVFFINFRADRMRELLASMVKDDFTSFDRGKKRDLDIMTLTEYDDSPVSVMFSKEPLKNILGEVISRNGLKQLRIAETEKYAHVTYFFNGGMEEPFPGEERILVPSPREVATYDLKPEMSIKEVRDKFTDRFKKGDLDLVIMNFANPDMVGHTGVYTAALKACKIVDEVIGDIVKVADEMGAVLLIAADHGNIEQMWDYKHNQPFTAHTTNPIRLIIHNFPCKIVKERGKLADIAPTILKIMGFNKPAEMTGDYLI